MRAALYNFRLIDIRVALEITQLRDAPVYIGPIIYAIELISYTRRNEVYHMTLACTCRAHTHTHDLFVRRTSRCVGVSLGIVPGAHSAQQPDIPSPR